MRKWLIILVCILALCGGVCWAVDFDGADDLVSIGATQALIDLPTTYNFTIALWFNSDVVDSDHAVFTWSGTDDLVFYPNDDAAGTGGVRVFWRDIGGTIFSEAGSDLSGEWHHFTFVSRAFDDHEAYRDGSSVATSSDTGNAGPFSDVLIGNFSTQFWDGGICEVAVWDVALSDHGIEQLALSRLKGMPLQIQPSNLVMYLPMDDEPDGTSFDGDTAWDRSGTGNDGTGDDGGNNTGLTAKAEEVLSYPPMAMIIPSVVAAPAGVHEYFYRRRR